MHSLVIRIDESDGAAHVWVVSIQHHGDQLCRWWPGNNNITYTEISKDHRRRRRRRVLFECSGREETLFVSWIILLLYCRLRRPTRSIYYHATDVTKTHCTFAHDRIIIVYIITRNVSTRVCGVFTFYDYNNYTHIHIHMPTEKVVDITECRSQCDFIQFWFL